MWNMSGLYSMLGNAQSTREGGNEFYFNNTPVRQGMSMGQMGAVSGSVTPAGNTVGGAAPAAGSMGGAGMGMPTGATSAPTGAGMASAGAGMISGLSTAAQEYSTADAQSKMKVPPKAIQGFQTVLAEIPIAQLDPQPTRTYA